MIEVWPELLQGLLTALKTCAEKLPDGGGPQRYTHRVLQTIQMKPILLFVWAEPAKATFKIYKIQFQTYNFFFI